MPPRLSYQERAKRIAEFYLRVEKNRPKVVAHFGEEGVPARTVHRIIRLYEKCGDVAFKRIPGRSKKISNDEAYEKIAALYKENPKFTAIEVAKQLGVSRSTFLRILQEMRQAGKETFKAPVENAICPTCRQKCDPELLESIRSKRISPKGLRNKKHKLDLAGDPNSLSDVQVHQSDVQAQK